MNKICTDINQSKKLIELGIDVNTADMYWWATSLRYYIEAMNDGDFDEREGHTPAWSLAALLELIPKEQHPKLVINAHYKWICDISNPFSFAYKPTAGDNPLDVVLEMVVWLKENGKI